MKKFRVTAEALNLRSDPSLQGNVIDVMAKDTVVDCLNTSGDGYWQKITTPNQVSGWASSKYLIEVISHPNGSSTFPWMSIAQAERGIREVLGNGDNPRIVQYLRSTTLGAPFNSQDETAWCSAFVNWCIEQAGYAGTDSAWARSWLNWGRTITTPVPGCIAVFKREGGGHVAFFVSKTDTKIKVLGGNQSNSVCELDYKADRLLGYRIPA